MTTGHAIAWEFEVDPSRRSEFEGHYGPDGSWAQLFRKAPGYISTELLNDREQPLRYITIDHWSSREHWLEFRRQHAVEYEALDRQCGGLTTREAPLGDFDRRIAGRALITDSIYPLGGGCDCRSILFRLETRPLFVHCCHCRWCQRESGASFAVNAMIESDRVTLLAGEPELVSTPSASGRGQMIARCPKCRIAVWSHYGGGGTAVRFVRVGTLDRPDLVPPDIHIFTSTKQPWIVLPVDTPAVPEFYDRKQYWPKESLARRETLLARLAAQRPA